MDKFGEMELYKVMNTMQWRRIRVRMTRIKKNMRRHIRCKRQKPKRYMLWEGWTKVGHMEMDAKTVEGNMR